ncbi:MAG: exo-alpha-sialidase [Limimaricola sp.]|uniref:WD40/YVTN/BNR-like repeat-containing protein n=1 Tax=Limimaricola sp. TaxID=2211665 RepID=UPI001D922F17|nr:sialidase family protein [Limimaricola sp.]MBI1416010.1 exo-alpha-sialidase [Limimaricola sp.]
MDHLHVATRKGLFRFDRRGTGWVLAGQPAFLAEPVSAMLDDPRDGTLYAALHHGHFGCKLHRSDDRGATWRELPTPAYPKSDAPDAKALFMIWTLVPGGADQPGTIWAGTIPGGLFRSDDRGESWVLNEALWNQPSRPGWFGGGYDDAGIHSILVDPADSATMLVGISCAGTWLTHDGGASWQVVGKGMMAEYLPPERADDPVGQDPHLLQACAADPARVWCQHHCGIYVSSDRGHTFTEIKEAGPSTFGFAVAAHPTQADTAWFAPAVKDASRVPVDGKLVVTRTDDGGRTFRTLSRGLPELSYDLIYRHALVCDATGTALAMGSTTGNLWTSDDGGESWTQLHANLPPIAQVAFA